MATDSEPITELDPSGGTAAIEQDAADLLFERYRDDSRRTKLLRGYYAVRPLVPRKLQIAARRRYSHRQAKAVFPAWPIETVLVDRHRADLRRRIDASPHGRVPLLNFWPDRQRFAYVLTHDVEGTAGVENIERVREVERRHGIVSSWNFCAEQYPIPDGLFDALRAEGCEIGLHGIDHRCKLFGSRGEFDSQLPAIHEYLAAWHCDGFRSPALHRNAEWMPELGCAYDTSFPDTDPYEPLSGGCCWPYPFFNEGMVELPVTLAQDHTLWEILRDESIEVWVRKVEWLREVHGLVNVIVHPDYVLSDERLALYDAFLAHLRTFDDGWHALPRDVASWWRARSSTELTITADGEIRPDGDPRATVAWARNAAGEIAFDL